MSKSIVTIGGVKYEVDSEDPTYKKEIKSPSKTKEITKYIVSPEFLKYFVPGLNTKAFAEDASENVTDAFQKIQNKEYRKAAGDLSYAVGNILMGVTSLTPLISSIKLNSPKPNKLIKKNSFKSDLIFKDSSKQIFVTPKNDKIPTKTYLWGLQTSKLSEAERLGIPKGERIPYTEQENIAFRNQINDFANKYGYEPIGKEITDPEVLERYARSLIKRHNTFYRGIVLPKKGTKQYDYLISLMKKSNPTELEMMKYMATHRDGELYITPFHGLSNSYGTSTEILRPYKLGSDRTKWFDEGNFTIYANGSDRTLENMKDFSGITAPWVYDEQGLGHIQGELTGWNQKFIPMRTDPRGVRESWLTDPSWINTTYDIERGSKNVPTVLKLKQGGIINYLDFFK